MNIGIMNCRNTIQGNCTASSCLKAFHERTGFFEGYGPDAKIVVCTDCGGCPSFADGEAGQSPALIKRLERFSVIQVDKLHLGVCINREKCPYFQEILGYLEESSIPYVLGTHKK